jgi:hypothetical protein
MTPKPHDPDPGVPVVVRRLHGLVTVGPWDLDIAWAMAAHGYDAVKWAEGQGLLAELVSCDTPAGPALAAAIEWYEKAATTAREALATQPHLLAKMGLRKTGSG